MRRRLRPVCFIATFFISGFIFFYFRYNQVAHGQPTKIPVMNNIAEVNLNTKHVTKSLAELGKTPELSQHVILFNRVPKTGSEMFVLLLQWLQGANNFKHVRLKGGDRRKLNRIEQEMFVNEVTDVVRDKAVPLAFDRHVYFVNFTNFNRQSPTYINIIRDPIEKFISRFYYKRATPNPRNPDVNLAPTHTLNERIPKDDLEDCVSNKLQECTFKNGQKYDLTIPYFCGQDERCMNFNDEWALATAKSNVERYYSVVGVLEELNATLEVFEDKLGYFFKGLQQVYFTELYQLHFNKNRNKPKVDEGIVKYLKDAFVCEYEFYEFVRQRLFQQLQILYGHSH